ncbi:hypothetical protein E2C01_037530 [Portunus trituberculatus]|uniref:Uncharacterized protein n=1 Tax=Portunus trituberculatus TaxID=210409 RepID=A0A5B7FEV0_PORTR|nr:hypothetical protein [Portunus trituberculatus]
MQDSVVWDMNSLLQVVKMLPISVYDSVSTTDGEDLTSWNLEVARVILMKSPCPYPNLQSRGHVLRWVQHLYPMTEGQNQRSERSITNLPMRKVQ